MRLARTEQLDGRLTFSLEISTAELSCTRLTSSDKKLLAECDGHDATISDRLLALEMIARRIEEDKMIGTEPKRIEVGTPEMERAFRDGVENYVPTAGGHEMKEEGGVAEVSLENLRELAQPGMCGPVRSIEIGKNQGMLVRFAGFECYLATGFSIGYRGDGPSGLAEFAAECGFGNRAMLLDWIAGLASDYRCVLYPASTARVTKRGFLDMQVCVPSEWTDEMVKAFADAENPCGTTPGWAIRRAGHRLLAGNPERVSCSDREGFVHIMLDA